MKTVVVTMNWTPEEVEFADALQRHLDLPSRSAVIRWLMQRHGRIVQGCTRAAEKAKRSRDAIRPRKNAAALQRESA